MYLCFCYYFEEAHFVLFSGLLVFLFVKLLYYTAYFLKKIEPFLHQIFFLVFCLTRGLKN